MAEFCIFQIRKYPFTEKFLKKVQKMPDDEITALLAFANSLESVKRTFISEIENPSEK